jgi:hypothetical protein
VKRKVLKLSENKNGSAYIKELRGNPGDHLDDRPDPAQPHLAWVFMLSFCDLAGSERISKTRMWVKGRKKKADNINSFLLGCGRRQKT